jgi:hypothetical protein
MTSWLLARISVADIVGIIAAGCVVYGLGLFHPAAGWIAAGLALSTAAVELGKQEVADRLNAPAASPMEGNRYVA